MLVRSLFLYCGSAVAIGFFAGQAGAMPVNTVPLSDGNVLDIQSIISKGPDSAYEVVDFKDGLNEAWQYNFSGSVGGYTMLSNISSATSLGIDATYYGPPYDEHLVNYLSDGPSNTTIQYPYLYISPPTPGDASATSSQGLAFEYSQIGIDQLTIGNGEIIGWDDSGSAVPIVPETAVPEPVSAEILGLVMGLATLRRRRA